MLFRLLLVEMEDFDCDRFLLITTMKSANQLIANGKIDILQDRDPIPVCSVFSDRSLDDRQLVHYTDNISVEISIINLVPSRNEHHVEVQVLAEHIHR